MTEPPPPGTSSSALTSSSLSAPPSLSDLQRGPPQSHDHPNHGGSELPRIHPYVRRRPLSSASRLEEKIMPSEELIGTNPYPALNIGSPTSSSSASHPARKSGQYDRLESRQNSSAQVKDTKKKSAMPLPKKPKPEPKVLFHRIGPGVSTERAQKSLQVQYRHMAGNAAALARKEKEEEALKRRRNR
ncbi:uncharacterized protein VTP21DRAFT_9146 [Calcarisporiella thermophila]|uniref:uncharacterized protein n=1 Tax=Calcarisporiella thermophila TaxID=911321 RepID=UPI003743F4FA